MAAKKKRSNKDANIEEFGDTPSLTDTENVVEFDPDAADVSTSSVNDLETEAHAIIPGEDFFKARDDLQAMLGGSDAFVAATQRAASSEGLGIENIQGIGVGMRSATGGYTGEMVVKVFVTEKAPNSRLTSDSIIPSEINGIPTDVEQIGEIYASTYKARYPRPVPSGVSCGEISITAGTIGCLVVLNNNRLCVLSNNHVLANENLAPIGSPIVQPGPIDGGKMPNDQIGVLESFVPINFSGANLVDAATAWTSFNHVSPRHVTYKMSPQPIAPSMTMSVMKNGRTTQATQGVITAIGVNNVPVRYSAGTAFFDDQVIIRGIGPQPFSQGGDSGSVIVSTNTRQPTALLFAGSTTHTIGNTIQSVISQLGINRFIGG